MSDENKQRTRDERARNAVDIMTKHFVTHSEKQGRKMSDAEARKKAVEIAERALKRNNQK